MLARLTSDASRPVVMIQGFTGSAITGRFISRRSRADDSQSFRSDAAADLLGRPLRPQGALIGVPGRTSTEVRPFTPAQIKLLESFADEAVIAIENARLLDELREFAVAADRYERNLWSHCQFADGPSART